MGLFNAISNLDLSQLSPQSITGPMYWAILTTSLLGSAHCIAMCGPLTLALTDRSSARWAYHIGRGISYTALGALMGTFGQGLFAMVSQGQNRYLKFGAYLFVMIIGSFLILSGLSTWIPKLLPLKSHIQRPFYRLNQYIYNVITPLRNKNAIGFAWAVGVGSVFLPCGWLYGFAAAAAAMGSTQRGATTMFIFWLGTIPALLIGVRTTEWLIQALGKRLGQRFGQLANKAVASVFILLGLYTLYARNPLTAFQSANTTECHCCHHDKNELNREN